MGEINNINHLNPSFSFVVPTFNRQDTIFICIESILKQITDSDEIIIIDDCSKDNTVNELVNKFGSYKNVIIDKNESNSGVSYTRNKGIDLASKDILIFIDSDDYLESGMIDYYRKIYSKYNLDLIISGLIYVNNQNKTKDTVKLKEPKLVSSLDEILKEIIYIDEMNLLSSPCNKAYYIPIIKNNGIYFPTNTSNLEDFEFNVEYIKHCKIVYLSNKAYYCYVNYNNQSLSSKFIPDLLEKYEYIAKLRNDLYDQIDNEDKIEILKKLNINYILQCINNLYRLDSPFDFKTRNRILEDIKQIPEMKGWLLNPHITNQYENIMTRIMNIKNVKVSNMALTSLHFFKSRCQYFYSNRIIKKLQR